MQRLNAAIAITGSREPRAFGSAVIANYPVAFEAQMYQRGDGAPLALQLHVMEDGYPVEPFGTLTTCVPGAQVQEDEVLVKTYFENDILREPLLASGYFEDTGRRVAAANAELEVWKITPAFVAAFATTYPTFDHPACGTRSH
jgi:hypothetical protein